MSKINMIKTFILNSDSHVEIDIKAGENGKMLLTVTVEEKAEGKSNNEQDRTALDVFLNKAVQLNLLDSDFKWLPDVTQSQKALWVEICCEKLNIPNKWAFAKKMWGLNNLKQYRNRSINEFGKVNDDLIVEMCFR